MRSDSLRVDGQQGMGCRCQATTGEVAERIEKVTVESTPDYWRI
ncbi:hypothetical protein [Nocardia vinacea]|nr:hypothetical protein [Nocardia vinacea]